MEPPLFRAARRLDTLSRVQFFASSAITLHTTIITIMKLIQLSERVV